MILEMEVSFHKKANGKREYSSIIVRIYLLLVADGKGSLKSTLSLSIGQVALSVYL